MFRAGGVVLYPTDTVYGLGADAFSDEAVAKIYVIKGRDEKKPIHCVVPDIGAAKQYAEVNDAAKALAEKFLPGPLTLVLKKRGGVESGIARGMDTIGIRIPNHEFCLALAREYGRPFTTTSANRAGDPPESSPGPILAQLREGSSLIDLVVSQGETTAHKPSTVVDVSSGVPIVLREGAIPASEIAA